MTDPLAGHRSRIDAIDKQILDLLQQRNELAAAVIATKIDAGLPVFVPEREQAKVAAFRAAAGERGLDLDWAEDFLRMIMSSSRARQSTADFPCATPAPKTILVVGGGGKLGSLYCRMFASSGHRVRVLEENDWDQAEEMVAGIDAVVVAVPIRVTTPVIQRLGPLLGSDVILADFTSHKAEPVAAMLAAHTGPVVGLHPMHGPDLGNLSKQLMIFCSGRRTEDAAWLLDQFRLWGLRVSELDPGRHDKVMHLVQGLRHFVAVLHGSFMRSSGLTPGDILDLSSPIYRAELMMTGRIFAQNAELYADIVFSGEDRRRILLDFFDHHGRLAELVRNDDKDGFIREFESIGEFFGDFAQQAMEESGYLIHRLADRFA
jgi:chorismate mutase/prephenate dehydrogenase